MRTPRPDHDGVHRLAFERNKKKIMATQNVCGICGRPVDKKIKYPDPMSACIDHIIPIEKGGHPSDLENLQLAHMCCNRQKADKLLRAGTANGTPTPAPPVVVSRNLPQSMDWSSYRG